MTYVPRIIRRRFERNPEPLTTPVESVFQGAILFIDISGFTALNERLSKLGPGGPEQVSKHLNTYFGQLIEAVANAGGDVLKFAGDALICMFGAPPSQDGDEDQQQQQPLCDVTLRAVQCALQIQSELAVYDSQAGFSLTLHVGVGAGTLHELYLGGVDGSWEFLVVGEPLLQLRSAVEESGTGEVVASPEAWALVRERCEGTARGAHGNVLVWAVMPRHRLALPAPTLNGWWFCGAGCSS